MSSPKLGPEWCDRSVFASCVVESRTTDLRCREKRRISASCCDAVRSLQSGLAGRNREKWPKFANFWGMKVGNSL
jgi:hypothetical protein